MLNDDAIILLISVEVQNGELVDQASLVSDTSCPLSCDSPASKAEDISDIHLSAIDSATAKLTLDDTEASEAVTVMLGECHDSGPVSSENIIPIQEVKTDCSDSALPFTFETGDSAVCPQKKDAREIVSAFDGHFNFLQESLIDEECKSFEIVL